MQAEGEQRGGQVQLVYTNDLTSSPALAVWPVALKASAYWAKTTLSAY